jgi:hypothetical protein
MLSYRDVNLYSYGKFSRNHILETAQLNNTFPSKISYDADSSQVKLEDGGTRLLQNISTYLPVDMAKHPRRPESCSENLKTCVS